MNGGKPAGRRVQYRRARRHQGAGRRPVDQRRSVSFGVDSERLRVNESDTGRVRGLLDSSDQCRHRLRAEVERRPVEDHQLLASAAELAADERQRAQHLGRQRRVRPESGNDVPRHRRSVRSGCGRIVYKSTDGGETWGPASSSATRRSSPTSRSTPAARRTSCSPGTNAGLFRSLNGGAT